MFILFSGIKILFPDYYKNTGETFSSISDAKNKEINLLDCHLNSTKINCK